MPIYKLEKVLTLLEGAGALWSKKSFLWGLTVEACFAEENRINYQTEGFEGLFKKRSGKIKKEGY